MFRVQLPDIRHVFVLKLFALFFAQLGSIDGPFQQHKKDRRLLRLCLRESGYRKRQKTASQHDGEE